MADMHSCDTGFRYLSLILYSFPIVRNIIFQKIRRGLLKVGLTVLTLLIASGFNF